LGIFSKNSWIIWISCKSRNANYFYDLPSEIYARSRFLDNLPRHKTFWPPIQRPETWFEMIFGPAPKVEAVPRYIYESKKKVL
jgi:hypothetical protein